MAGRIAVVAFLHGAHEWYCVVDGQTLHEAVRAAIAFFAHPYWRGPKPRADEIYKVSAVGDDRLNDIGPISPGPALES